MTEWQHAPWLQRLWQQLADTQTRHAHAIAIEAQPGLGAEAVLKDFIALRLCEAPGKSPDGSACGQCASCGWLASGQHPDLRLIRPAALEAIQVDLEALAEDEDPEQKTSGRKLSQDILIEQIRPLAGFLQVGSHRAGARIVWIEPAQRLNRSAANALLKMLEEPGEGAIWILLTQQLSSLLPTIRSRCICLKVSPPDAGVARRMLEALLNSQQKTPRQGDTPKAALISLALGLSHHAPWAAQQRLLDPVLQAQQAWLQTLAETPQGWFSTLARQWADHSPEQWFDLLERWAMDLLQASHQLEPIYFKTFSEAALYRVKSLGVGDCFTLIERLFAMKANLRHPLNPRLHAESALLLYADFCRGAAKC